jgi:hypothetical protein
VFSSITDHCYAAFLSPAKEVFAYCADRQQLGGPAELRSFVKSNAFVLDLDATLHAAGDLFDIPATDADVDVCTFMTDISTKDELRRSFVQTFFPSIEYDGLFGDYIRLNSGDAKNYYTDWVRVLLLHEHSKLTSSDFHRILTPSSPRFSSSFPYLQSDYFLLWRQAGVIDEQTRVMSVFFVIMNDLPGARTFSLVKFTFSIQTNGRFEAEKSIQTVVIPQYLFMGTTSI